MAKNVKIRTAPITNFKPLRLGFRIVCENPFPSCPIQCFKHINLFKYSKSGDTARQKITVKIRDDVPYFVKGPLCLLGFAICHECRAKAVKRAMKKYRLAMQQDIEQHTK